MGILSDGETDKADWCSADGLKPTVVGVQGLGFKQIQGGQQIGILDLHTFVKKELVIDWRDCRASLLSK